ncbi:hypothetical protein HX798_28575 [Pseudomonas putida]|uniref:Uncharacterized protein n=1 Tax=Pseudomonas putida TaxID=303 RepID=A0A7Y7ZI69_PSEPU|nr:hypothetical protein [Pseudomonas putida]NWC84209.1 hypothetical protein [Pseudomonas putida]
MNAQHVTSLTAHALQEIKQSNTLEARAMRDFILNISFPEIYDFPFSRLDEMTDTGFTTALDILRALRAKEISQQSMETIALELERATDQSDACLEVIGSTSIRVVVAKKRIASVSAKYLSLDQAKKRARWIRDNYLLELKGTTRLRKAAFRRKCSVKGISLISNPGTNLFIYQVRSTGEHGRPTTKQFSVVKLGFDGAFRAALAKAGEENPQLDMNMKNPYSPTEEEYESFKHRVPDLPKPAGS